MKTKNKLFILFLCVILVATSSVVTVASPLTVNPTASTVLINGTPTDFEAYLIHGNNFFRLRDLAYALNGSNKQFAVDWDAAANAISLTSGQPYIPVGGEMAPGDGTPRTATPTTARVFLDGTELNATAYNIDGNNFFRLRDIMRALDIGVTWDATTSTIGVDTSVGYQIEEEYSYEFVGSIFVSPAFNLIMLISHPDWHFAHDERTGRVYFFNYVNICEASLISMSAIEFSGDARRAIEQRWDVIRRGYESVEILGFVYKGSRTIQVGDNYSGNLHNFELREDDMVFTSSVVLWTVDNLLYTLVTTATTQRVEEVQGVLQGFLETFINLNEFMSDFDDLMSDL